ncbi:MAG: phage tail tape measure protein, partial [Rhodobacteraceae bacterium]|nr:phage tail tape measure protein [Paracoccaceae bacterium]
SGDVLNDIADRFAGYEDSAAKAALAQAIFGRSGADLIPLLNAGSQGLKEMGDEASRLGVVISTETAQAAERFNDQMTRVNAALGSIAKQTAADLLPVLNELADSLVAIAKEGSGASHSFNPLSEAFRAILVVGGNVAYVFKSIGTEIGGMAAQLVALARLDFQGFSNIGEAMREDAEKSRKAIDAWSARVLSAGKSAGQTFNDYSNEGRGRGLPGPAKTAAPNFNVPKVRTSGGGRAAKAVDDGQRLVDQLRDQIRATQNLSEVEKLEAAIADGKYRTASAANIEIARGYAETLDAIKANKTAAEEEAEAVHKKNALHEEGARVAESVRTPFEALNDRIAYLLDLLNRGAIDMETFGRAASQAGEGFIKMGEKAKETSDVMDEFARSAATNIQSAFADFLFDPFKDGMSGMLKSFGETIKRMIAEAVAADLSKRLFGDLAKGGVGDGLLGGAFKLLGGLLPNADGGVYRSPSLSRFSGQIVTSPRIFAFAAGAGVMGEAGPEAILPLSRGSDGKLGVRGGGSTSVTVNIHGVTNAAELRRAGGQVGREVLAAISRAQRFA